jgi:hypothetical protein
VRDSSTEWESDSGIGLGDDDDKVGNGFLAGLTVDKLSEGLGRQDITEESLRAAMFRYALYLSYSYRGAGQAPSLWVFDAKVWRAKD